jgi:hypothetical protein
MKTFFVYYANGAMVYALLLRWSRPLAVLINYGVHISFTYLNQSKAISVASLSKLQNW